MASIGARMVLPPRAGRTNLMWAFVERQTNLWKRYWAWELVWLVYGAVNTLAVTFIAKQGDPSGAGSVDVSRLGGFLVLRTLVLGDLSALVGRIHPGVPWGGWGGTGRP